MVVEYLEENDKVDLSDMSDLNIQKEMEIPYLDEGKINQGSCSLMEDVKKDTGKTDLYLKRELRRKYKLLNQDPNTELDHFNDNMIDHPYSKQGQSPYLSIADFLNMENFQAKKWPIADLKKGFRWAKYLFNETDPTASRIRCEPCNKYSRLANIKPEDMDVVSKDDGILHPTRSQNLLALKRHDSQSQHNTVDQWLKEVAKAEIKEDDYPMTIMSNMPGYPNDPVFDEYTVTSRMLRTVYLESKVSQKYFS